MNFNITIPPSSIGGWISLGILAYVALTVLLGLIAGLRRGFTKTLIRIITTVVAAAAAFFAVSWIIGAIDSVFAGKTLEEVITSFYADYQSIDPKVREIISAFDAETAELLVGGIFGLILAPIVFIVAFGVARLVLLLVDWLLGAILGKTNRHKGATSTLTGGLLGIVQGVIVSIVILIPISGVLSLANDVKADLLAREDISVEEKASIEEFYAQYLDEAIANPLIPFVNEKGGEKLYTELSKAKVGDKTYVMTERASLAAGVAVKTKALKNMNWQTPTPKQEAALEAIIDTMEEDEYTARVLAGILRGSGTALCDNIEAFGLTHPYDELFKEAFGIFTTSDESNVGNDLDTMLHVYFIMADNELLTLISANDVEGMKTKLTEKVGDELIIDNIIGTLQENERTACLVTLFTKLSVSIMADSLGLDEDTMQLYEDLKGDLNGVLSLNRDSFDTDEEYKAEVNTQLSTALESNGILLEDDIVAGMTDYIAENYSDGATVTDEAINDAILSYYSAYVDYVNGNGEAPTLPDGMEIPTPDSEA